jgi:low temperature requirement protein LtrA
MAASASVPVDRHLRRRDVTGPQPTTQVELLFDLVYVFAVTQLSHLVLEDLSLAGLVRAAFLLVVVWWAWIYTAWMTNWFDPASGAVQGVLGGVMLASLLAAAALPLAFGADAVLFASSYVALQVGRNVAALSLLGRGHRLRDIFARLVVWSLASGALWLLGAAVGDDPRIALWVAALALDLLAPVAGYRLPRHGRAATTEYDIEAGHFTERCRLFVLIALGESIVLTGGSAAHDGLTARVVACLVLAFLETLALWALYFGPAGERSRRAVLVDENPGRLARDAYTYVHIPIVAGIVLVAAADHLLIAESGASAHGPELALFLGGPVLFLLGLAFFQRLATGTTNVRRVLTAAGALAVLPLGGHVSLFTIGAVVTALLCGLVLWELSEGRSTRSLPASAGRSAAASR